MQALYRSINFILNRFGKALVDVSLEAPQASGKVFGLWEPVAWGVQAHIFELADKLRRQQRIFREAPDWQVFDAILRGQLEGVPLLTGPMVWNKVTQKLLEDTFAARIVNANTSDEDLRARYLAVGTNYTQPAYAHTSLFRETLRKTPLTQAQDGKYAKLYLFLDLAEANGAQTTIASGTNNTTTITVASATGFNIGDAIRVGTSPQPSFSSIVAIDGTELSLDPAEPLLSTPTVSQAVLVCIGETGSFGNQNATGTAGSGDMFSRSRLRWPKTSSQAMMIRHSIFGEPA
jgi:hypothetical protein